LTDRPDTKLTTHPLYYNRRQKLHKIHILAFILPTLVVTGVVIFAGNVFL